MKGSDVVVQSVDLLQNIPLLDREINHLLLDLEYFVFDHLSALNSFVFLRVTQLA